jgi:hypothetical protein
MTLPCELIAAYVDRFVNRLDIWGRAVADRDNPNHVFAYFQKPDQEWPPYEPVTPGLVREHLAGSVTCHWTAIDENSAGRWLAFDDDSDDDGDGYELDKLEAFLIEHSWHILRTKGRPDRGGHLFLCIDQPVSAKLLRVFGMAAIKQAKVEGLEIFPKSDTGLSSLRGPLGVNVKPAANQARDWFVEDGLGQDIQEQLLWLSQQPINQAEDIIRVAEEWKPIPRPARRSIPATYTGQIDFQEVAQAALLHAPSIVENWLPGGRGSTHYQALNPRRNDTKLGSFSVNLRNGRWKDFACDVGGGDLISLIAYLENSSQLEAARKLASFLGVA